jgi:hypothetical protein
MKAINDCISQQTFFARQRVVSLRETNFISNHGSKRNWQNTTQQFDSYLLGK